MLYVNKQTNKPKKVNARLCDQHNRIANGMWELILEIHEQVWTCPGGHQQLCQEKTFHSQQRVLISKT